MKIAGVILAGGKATRMEGANKALLMLGGKPLVTHAAERLANQVDILGINANRDLQTFLNMEFRLPIVEDGIGGELGPLDGILGAMLFAARQNCSHALTVSVDTPFVPLDLAIKLKEKAKHQIAVASTNGHIHGTCGLWPVSESTGLKNFILSGKSLKLLDYLTEAGFLEVPFYGDKPDPFFNINTPDHLAAALRWL